MVEAGYLIRLVNISLRGATLSSKFLLVFFLANYLEPSDLGLYGLLIATIAYGMYPLGFDFFSYATREIIKADQSIWGRLLKSQAALHLRLYLFFLPVYLGFFYFGLLPWNVCFWFFLLLLLEHINQECMRLLIAMSKQLSASLALFLRQGVWSLAVVIWMYIDVDARNLETIFLAWSLGSILAIFISFYTIWSLPITGWQERVDWLWVKRGLKIAIPFFLATLSLSTVSTFDKYWFGYFQGVETLGAYVFYISLAASFISFLDAGVFSFIYPRMIYAANKKDFETLVSCMRKMTVQIIFFSIVFSVVSFFSLKKVLEVIDKQIYLDNLNIFYILVMAMIVHGLSYVPHYALYAQGKDRAIIQSHVSSIFIFSVCVIVLSFWSDLYSVPCALLITYSIILVWKFIVFKMKL